MIDGVVQPYGTLPYRCGKYFYLVSLDLDGNRLDTKIANYLSGKYCQDSKGNHYFLENNHTLRSGPRNYIQLNDDTTQKFYYPLDNSYVYPPVFDYKITPYLIKINPEWTNVTITQLTDSLNGYRNIQGDSVFRIDYIDGYIFCSFKIDEQGLFYISGLTYGPLDLINSSRPLELKFNSGATLWWDRNHSIQNFVLSMDTMGYVRWVQGYYFEKYYDAVTGDYASQNDQSGGVFVDSNYVYYLGGFYSSTRIKEEGIPIPENVPMLNVFFDRNHQDTLFFPNPNQYYVASIVKYDKKAGEYISHISLRADSVGTRVGRGALPYVSENYIITNASNTFINNCTYRYNRHTCSMEVYDTIVSSAPVYNKGVLVCDNGFVEKWVNNMNYSLQSPNFYIPSGNQSILYYYDTLLDKRRRGSPPEDSTAVEGVGEINIKVFPNPASDIVNIVVSEPIRQIMLYDVDGRIVKSIKIGASTSTSIDIGDCPQGVYILKISTMSGESVGKIIRI